MTDEILYRYFRNEATPHEVGEIEAWLDADPAHQSDFDAAHALYNVSELEGRTYMAHAGMDRDSAVSAVSAVSAASASSAMSVGSASSSRAQKRGKRHSFWKYAASSAAAVLLAVTAGFLGMEWEHRAVYEDLTAKTNVINVPAGERISLTLQDGTRIQLNGGSRLEYPVLFEKDVRKVKLSGEAYLKVARNEAQPFVVETFASDIEVLGTEFNVLADEKNGFFSTVLVSGKVKVTTVAGQDGEYEQVILNPDEKVKIVGNHLVVSRILASDEISWKDGYINLRGVNFVELMHRFESMFGTDILIARNDVPEIGYLSGKIKVSEGIDFALHLLQEACDFTYEKDAATGAVIIK